MTSKRTTTITIRVARELAAQVAKLAKMRGWDKQDVVIAGIEREIDRAPERERLTESDHSETAQGGC